MQIKVKVETMKDAEKLSYVCNTFPYEMYLRAEKYCADPKSTLGVLAMMYTTKDKLLLDTGDMPDETIRVFSDHISDFIRNDEQA